MKHWKQDPDFMRFWDKYPRRDETPRISGAKEAYVKLKRVVRDCEATWDDIVAGVEAYARCDRVTGKSSPTGTKYIKAPTTFITKATWEDEYEAAPVPFEQKAPGEYTEEDWRKRFGDVNGRFGRELYSDEKWSPYFGPRPPHPDSIVPPVIQDEYRIWWPDLRVVKM